MCPVINNVMGILVKKREQHVLIHIYSDCLHAYKNNRRSETATVRAIAVKAALHDTDKYCQL